MKVYEFGNSNSKKLILIPGTCCHWKKTFKEVIPLLEKEYNVFCVSFSGFDETENTTYISTLDEVEKIEKYVIENCNGLIDIAYGSSLGGSIVSQLIQRKNIHINKGIIGSSDMDQSSVIGAKLKCMIAIPLVTSIIKNGEYPALLRGIVEKKRTPYRDKMMEMFGMGTKDFAFVTKESIYNQFYSDLVTHLDEKISVEGTKIYVFYAKKMGEKYLKRYNKYYLNPKIIPFDMEHEELLVCHPNQWVEEVNKIANG